MSRNVIFVSHCDFKGNSAMHLFSIANVLTDLGHSCAVCVPGRPETVLDHGNPRFPVLGYEEAVVHGVSFPDGRGPDLVHAWTPRELVREMTMSLVRRYNIPYFVHLEDNEVILLVDELRGCSLADLERMPTRALDIIVPNHRIHPHRSRRLLAGAAGVTALIHRLLEFKPAHVPGLVFFPGHDADFAKIDGRDEETRAALGVVADEVLVVYTGNVHSSNFQEVRSLVLAVALVNRRGFRVKLVKTGLNPYVLPELSDPEIAQHVIDCGFVTRSYVPRLLAAADVLVQPGPSSEFNDYRFPSKLPEFMATGRPVILPCANVGLLLKDGKEALVLERGDSVDIADALQRLAADPELRTRIGRGGRTFALNNLNWAKNVGALPSFYNQSLAAARPTTQSSVGDDPASPKLIAFYLPQFHPIPWGDASWGECATEWTSTAVAPTNFEGHIQPPLPGNLRFSDLGPPATIDAEVAVAIRFGVFGFCFFYYWFNGRRLLERPLNQILARGQPDFPFCICWANEDWSRPMRGEEHEVLIKQEYGQDFSEKFIHDVIPILKDPRYIKVRDDPVLMVYRVSLLPNPRATTETWRAECRNAGIPSIHLVAIQSVGIHDPRPLGFDAAVEFPPDARRTFKSPRGFSGVSPRFEGHSQNAVIDRWANDPPNFTLYRSVTASCNNPPRNNQQAHTLVPSSPEGYQTWLKRVTAQTMALAEVQAPLIFVSSWNDWAEGAILGLDVHRGNRFLEATRAGLNGGFTDYLRAMGVRIDEARLSNLPMRDKQDMRETKSFQKRDRTAYKTEAWFTRDQLADVAAKFRGHFLTMPLSYGTVRDFCDSFDNLRPIATANGDLKDNQRPWVLKAILSVVPPGSRVLEIGAGEPFIADILDRLGYEVWVVDPYDGTGNGPLEYERFRNECPNVRFVRGLFGEQVLPAPPAGFDCIYSISVLEHIAAKDLEGVFAGIKKYLRLNGCSIHAVDHVRRGQDAVKHYENIKAIVCWSGFDETDLTQLLDRMDADHETYYLSAESHNRWRGSLPYDEFPMRVCVSIQIISRAEQLRPIKVSD